MSDSTLRSGAHDRVAHANALLNLIAQHGRRFFYDVGSGRVARFEWVDGQGVTFRDHYTDGLVRYRGRQTSWRKFSQGGTMRGLVENLFDYIRTGRLLNPEWIAPAMYKEPPHDLWAYGEAAAPLRTAAHALPLFRAVQKTP